MDAGLLSRLIQGAQLLVCHPGVETTELERLAGPNSVPYRRATEYPPADLELLAAPDVGARIDDLGITSCCFPETLSGVHG